MPVVLRLFPKGLLILIVAFNSTKFSTVVVKSTHNIPFKAFKD